MKVCEKCNNKFTRDIDTCPLCGGKVVVIPGTEEPAPPAAPAEPAPVEAVPAEAAAAPEAPAAAPEAAPAAAPAKKKGSKKVWIIAAVILAAIVGGVAWYNSYTAPRPLIINGDESINVNVGESAELKAAAEGLDGDHTGDIEWTILNPDIVTIENAAVTGHYDKASFAESGTGDSCSTLITGTLKDGLRTWTGDSTVFVHLVPVEFTNGQLIKESASKDTYSEINNKGTYNLYLYFKSTSDPENDAAIMVAAGSSAKIDLSYDTYEIYEAAGETWYGTDIKFGPSGSFQKFNDTTTIPSGQYLTLSIGVTNGNIGSNNIDEDEFPDA